MRPHLTAAALAAVLIWTGSAARAQDRPPDRPDLPPDINRQFADPDVADFVKRFETESREVYARREAIVASLGLTPGMTVADVGAGTGLFTRLIADRVGPKGTVLAVDVSEKFLRHVEAESKARGQTQVKTVRCSQDSAGLPDEACDLVFVCDVYHHVERPAGWLASIRSGLKPGGRFVLIEFDRARAKNQDFVRKHVRADRETFVREVKGAGFVADESFTPPELGENFMVRFLRAEGGPK